MSERKHRPLLELENIAPQLCIMYTTNVPKQFWPNAFLAACYLINGMPSSVLNFVSPFSVLFPDDPLHVVQPRVFGCVCIVHNLDHPHDKLSAKAIRCVFIGYPPYQKGYKSLTL